MAASLKRLFGQDTAGPPEAANAVSTAESRPQPVRAPDFRPVVPPKRVRRTRMLVVGAALATLGWLGYLAYQQWLIYADPIGRAVSGTVSAPPPQAEPAPEPPTPHPAPAAMAPPRQAAAAPSAPRVTHTLREDAKPPAAAAAPVPRAPPPAHSAVPCTEAVAALGFCTPAPAAGGANRENQ